MTFNEYQEKAGNTAVYPAMYVVLTKKGDAVTEFKPFGLWYPSMGLAGEVGEFANKVKKLVRDKKGHISQDDKMALSDELGDILWYVAMCAKELGLELDRTAINNILKLEDRQLRGVLKGEGDGR